MVEASQQSNSLLLCYKLSEYKVDSWLTHLLNDCITNAQFKAAIVEVPFIVSLKESLSELYEKKEEEVTIIQLSRIIEIALEDSRVATKSEDNSKYFVTMVVFLMTIYARENMLGPSIYSQYVEDTKAPLESTKKQELVENDMDFMSFKNEGMHEALLKHFEKDGEAIYHRSQFLIYLLAAEILLKKEQEGELQIFCKLWRARMSFWITQHLSSSVVKLMDEALDFYQEYIEAVRQVEGHKETLCYLLAEQHYAQLFFYKYEGAEASLKEARQLANLPLELTGKMGKRTKYQQNNIAQLTLDFSTREFQLEINEDANNLFGAEAEVKEELIPKKEEEPIEKKEDEGAEQNDEEPVEEELKDKVIEQYVKLDAETILFEHGPKFEEQIRDKELSLLDLTLLTAEMHSICINFPDDEIRQEMVQAFSNACTKVSKNWLMYSAGLLLRSRNEQSRSKTMERGLGQVQALIDQYREQTIAISEKCDLMFVSGLYPFKQGMIKELGQMYCKLGIYVSAYELYNEIEMYEDAVVCLCSAGRETQATALCDKILSGKKGSTLKINQANILCCLGDIKRDPELYMRAWEDSEHRCSRAMRTLGSYWFMKEEYQKSVECFNLAFNINKLYPKHWFTCGCAYMRLEQWDKAIFAFGVVVQIDERSPEAWGNIASCYNVQGKYTEALVCCEQALKENRKNWKIWNNMIQFAIITNHFYKAVYGVNQLLAMGKFEGLNSSMLMKISEVFLHRFALNEDKTLNKESLEQHKPYLYRFYKNYQEHISDYQVWRLIGRIKSILQEDPAEIKEDKMCEARSLMKQNWNVQIEICELVERCMCELVGMDAKAPLSVEEKAFVRNAAIAIEESLRRPFKIEDIVQRYK